MYREGNMKIIYRETDDSWQLYDMDKDPKEQNNIFDQTTTTEYLMKKVLPRVGRYLKK